MKSVPSSNTFLRKICQHITWVRVIDHHVVIPEVPVGYGLKLGSVQGGIYGLDFGQEMRLSVGFDPIDQLSRLRRLLGKHLLCCLHGLLWHGCKKNANYYNYFGTTSNVYLQAHKDIKKLLVGILKVLSRSFSEKLSLAPGIFPLELSTFVQAP